MTPTANATEVNKNIPAGTEPIIGPAAFKNSGFEHFPWISGSRIDNSYNN